MTAIQPFTSNLGKLYLIILSGNYPKKHKRVSVQKNLRLAHNGTCFYRGTNQDTRGKSLDVRAKTQYS